MSFNYEKHKNHQDDGHFWTSYSDLFLGLSTIFLLLYVTSSLRTNTSGMKQQMEKEELNKKVQILETKVATYESMARDAMKKEATKSRSEERRVGKECRL